MLRNHFEEVYPSTSYYSICYVHSQRQLFMRHTAHIEGIAKTGDCNANGNHSNFRAYPLR